jgi:hypothetical protein
MSSSWARGIIGALIAFVMLLLERHFASNPWASEALHEFAFAILVSLFVWAGFEVFRAADAEADWNRRIEAVSKDVFFSVLRKDLPQKLLDEVNCLIFDTAFVRSSFNVSYTMSDEAIRHNGDVMQCVVLSAVLTFRVTNIGRKSASYPVRMGLPDPVHPALRARCVVNDLDIIKHGVRTSFLTPAAQADLKRQIDEPSVKQAFVYNAGEVVLEPNESIEVRADHVMIKEAEDSELMTMLYPCDGLTITITDRAADRGRAVFARAVHRVDLEDQSSRSNSATKIFRIRSYLLPHQGVLIWWKRQPTPAEGVGRAGALGPGTLDLEFFKD